MAHRVVSPRDTGLSRGARKKKTAARGLPLAATGLETNRSFSQLEVLKTELCA
jgi:hypothetical protein